jgi:hypothetical protein
MDSAKVFIDTDNEITFILEKILTAKSDKVCLVVPDRASLFTSISGLKLIKRIVDNSSKLLIMVTLDENGSELAKKSGLKVVSRVGEITDSLWEEVQKFKFEFVKKNKNRVYYQPETIDNAEEVKVSTEENTISVKQLIDSSPELPEEQNNIPEQKAEVQPEEVQEAPQIRIKVDYEDIADARSKDYQEIHLPDNNIDDSFIPQSKSFSDDSPGVSDNERANKYLENNEKNDTKSMLRMRKTAQNSTPLNFTFGKDINPQKKN